MAGQYQKLVNKQFNSPIGLYSDRNVKEILERETQILANGAVGIDFSNPMINKPANLQNSAVLRMLEEEENRKRDGQPGSLKRVAWPPPSDSDFVEQPPVQSQGGPLFSSKSAPGLQNNQASTEQPLSPNYQQAPQSPSFQAVAAEQTVSPNYRQAPQSPNFQPISTSGPQSPYQSAPLSPVVSKSPVSFSPVAKPWAPVQSPSFNQLQFRSVQAPQTMSKQTVQTNQSSVQQYQYSKEYQTQTQSAFQKQYQVESQSRQQYQQPSQLQQQYQSSPQPQSPYQTTPTSPVSRIIPIQQAQPSSPTTIQSGPTAPKSPVTRTIPVQVQPSSPKIQSGPPQQFKSPIQPSQSQPSATAAQGTAQSQAPQQYRGQSAAAARPVEPPPSTITLRPQAPVSQAPPPVITSQPATATLRGGKKLRGDLKWPPEEVKDKMEAEKQHLIELEKGPQFRPRKQHKDYTRFFAQHALNSTYPGYKIPPGTQFYDHNPVM